MSLRVSLTIFGALTLLVLPNTSDAQSRCRPSSGGQSSIRGGFGGSVGGSFGGYIRMPSRPCGPSMPVFSRPSMPTLQSGPGARCQSSIRGFIGGQFSLRGSMPRFPGCRPSLRSFMPNQSAIQGFLAIQGEMQRQALMVMQREMQLNMVRQAVLQQQLLALQQQAIAQQLQAVQQQQALAQPAPQIRQPLPPQPPQRNGLQAVKRLPAVAKRKPARREIPGKFDWEDLVIEEDRRELR